MTSGPTILGAWLQLETVGLLTALGAVRRLASTQSTEKAPAALAGATRAEVLAATCFASEAAWSRLVRAALRLEHATDAADGGYREGPSRSASPELVRLRDTEIASLRVHAALGALGALAVLATGARLLTVGFAFIGALSALVGGVLVWRLAVHAQRSRRALATTFDALPDLVARLDPAPPVRPIDASLLPIRLPGNGCVAAMLAVPTTTVLLLLASDTTTLVDSAHARLRLFALLFFTPLVGVTAMTLVRARIELDAEHAEIVVTKRILGLPWSRTRVPVEIFFGASTRDGSRHSKKLFLDLASPGAAVEIYDGYDALPIAAKLNRLVRASASP